MTLQQPHFQGPLASLDVTHVLYDDSSFTSFVLALITLSPILLMPAYAALAYQTREYIIIVMWIGQFFGEGLNLVIKRIVKEERPNLNIGDGYGFPSSHSQYMAYFTTFLYLHLFFSHRFTSTGSPLLDRLWRTTVYGVLAMWMGVVAYSRYALGYHTPLQIFWGLAIGCALAVVVYTLTQLVPSRYPNSVLGKTKRFILTNPLCTWLRIRDGWEVWGDAGVEDAWWRWRAQWEKKMREKGVDVGSVAGKVDGKEE
ncbi:hypothetical protein CC1G_09792 [Coprinopsis cinerea okayama7|uniref:Phosphatidic acid phosphatase type 2/haloperoxidase domain-containing protein n=1 Tax=Coprinopsis cinerea (strain Okayama-7 / 130 / ATCC MYA-4618 / FGSC 9003) TaxID=240176 RepID=A8NM87_COPC7|nr:hypothetical protein CC1G_09792 [Coprinopsis cinerea okayama7\|eukprot:XP_001834865.2 hypothetical protein CC1G_09792 [Coprinopsis cinerea okayama7\